MARITREERQKIMDKYGVDDIWSYSRVSVYSERPWEFMIRYIRKEKVDTSNVYTHFGEICHSIIQDYIEGKYPQSKMIDLFNEAVLQTDLEGKYEFMNDNVRKGYIDNLQHYFKHTHYPIDTMDKTIEKTVMTLFKTPDGKPIVFIGYIDLLTTDPEDGKVVVVDFKTSSSGKFTGKALQESARQLKLYAMGISQMYKIPIEKIKLRYDMQKYLTVSFLQKNGKWSKPTLKERTKWVPTQEARIRKGLEDLGYDMFEADLMYERAVHLSSLEEMPEELQERFKLDTGMIELDMTQEIVDEMNEWIVKHVTEAERRAQAEDLDEEFPEPVDIDSEFFYNVLAPAMKPFNKAWAEKQELKRIMEEETKTDDIDIDDLFS